MQDLLGLGHGYADIMIYTTQLDTYLSLCYGDVFASPSSSGRGDTITIFKVEEHGELVGVKQHYFQSVTGQTKPVLAHLRLVMNRCPFTPDRITYKSEDDAVFKGINPSSESLTVDISAV